MRKKCFQREKREAEAKREPRPQDTTLDYTIGPITADEATAFIKRYEWLNTLGHPSACYGARDRITGEIVAVAVFGKPNLQSTLVCRRIKNITKLTDEDRAYIATVACLERGACAHWAHPHTASWFIPRVLKLAHEQHGWKIFYAYSDMNAGEIGTIYQACNWLYIGQGNGRGLLRGKVRPRWLFWDWVKGQPTQRFPLGWISSRAFFRPGRTLKEHVWKRNGKVLGKRTKKKSWEERDNVAKHKYVQFVCDTSKERRVLIRALRYPSLPYPKRGPQQSS